jgi:hypothetical protein
MTGNKKRSGKELFDDDKYNPDQKHNHGNFINPMHHSQVYIGRAAGVILSKKITKYFTQAEILFNSTHAILIYGSVCLLSCQITIYLPIKLEYSPDLFTNY